MNKDAAVAAVKDLLAQHAYEAARFDRIDAALRPWSREDALRRFGIHEDGPGVERQVQIAQHSQSLFLPLVLDTFAQSMKVDNLIGSDGERSAAWTFWKQNVMDAVQTGITRAALQYGTSYAVVCRGELFGKPAPIITAVSPRNMVTYYGERYAWPDQDGVSTEWPILALEIKENRLRLFDETNVYYFGAKRIPASPAGWAQEQYNSSHNLEFIESRPHGADVVPVVRFRDRWLVDGQPQQGIVEPLINMQGRIDDDSYSEGITLYFSAFKQRYVIGWAPKEEDALIKVKQDTTWFINADGQKTKVGQFNESDLGQYVEARQAAIRDFAAVAQVPAQFLGVSAISNVSAEGLALMESARERKTSELQTSLGESYEQLLRLCAFFAGDMATASDFGAEIRWRDYTARSFAQTVDGLGKVAAMLNVPAQTLWEDVPGFNADKIERIKHFAAANPQQNTAEQFEEDEM